MEREHVTGCLDKFKSTLVDYNQNNSPYPSNFSIGTKSIKFLLGSRSVLKRVKRYFRFRRKFIYTGITKRQIRWACALILPLCRRWNPPSTRTHFAAFCFDCLFRLSLKRQKLHSRDVEMRENYEIKRSSQLRTLMKRVVENRTGKKFRPVRDLNPWPLRYRCSALPTELTSQLGADQCVGSDTFWLHMGMKPTINALFSPRSLLSCLEKRLKNL